MLAFLRLTLVSWTLLAVADPAIVFAQESREGSAIGKPSRSTRSSKQRPSEKNQKTERASAADSFPEETIEGFGETSQKAREAAVVQARNRLEQILGKQLGLTRDNPLSARYDAEFLLRSGALREIGEPVATLVQGEKPYVARYAVKISQPLLEDVTSQIRFERVRNRHAMVARLLIAILAVLLATTGYLRLDEFTHGYASKLLMLAAGLLVGVVGVFLLRSLF